MHKYLPSKRFSLTLLSIILALVIIYGVSFFVKSEKSAPKLAATENNTRVQEFIALDSDGDELKDWEEALWKTDPKNADTDGDGTGDGLEIKANRDPLKANTAKSGETPTDLFDVEVVAANKKADEDFAKLSQTDQLARTFFSQYIASKSASGATLNNSNKQIILDTAISKIETPAIKKYYATDIKITDNLSTTSLKEYGNKLGQAFFTGTAVEKVANELDTITKAAETQDEKVLDDLDPIIESYNNTITKILMISVPRDATFIHLKFLNDLLSLKTSLEEIKKMFSDPVQAISGMERYKTSTANIKADLTKIKSYFSEKKIIFNQNEYGYILLSII